MTLQGWVPLSEAVLNADGIGGKPWNRELIFISDRPAKAYANLSCAKREVLRAEGKIHYNTVYKFVNDYFCYICYVC